MKSINKYNVVSIRYNTNSDGNTNTWRLICDGVEYLTNKIHIKGDSLSSKDLLKDDIHEHHITIKNAIVDYSVDYTLIENNKKNIVIDIIKTITYRILGTSVTFGIGYVSTGNLNVAVALGFSDLILKPIVYFLHERLWRLYKNR
jgi:uncharacterized membrane protein